MKRHAPLPALLICLMLWAPACSDEDDPPYPSGGSGWPPPPSGSSAADSGSSSNVLSDGALSDAALSDAALSDAALSDAATEPSDGTSSLDGDLSVAESGVILCLVDCDCPQGQHCSNLECIEERVPFYCCDKPGCPEGELCTDQQGLPKVCGM